VERQKHGTEGRVTAMAEHIDCRNCDSPNCKGCNIYTLATMLNAGKFDCLMNANRSINPAADVVEVVHDYHEGDVCIYGYGAENKSRAIVEIVKILNDERGVAEVKFHKVFVDDTGNGLFNYLLRSGKTMNASFRYLKNITPRMDGDSDG
jgi:hypothetical protein